MDTEQVKRLLLSLEYSPNIQIKFSGKKTKKINGFYDTNTATIVLNELNFKSDNLLMYTAIHEYAHHLHAVQYEGTLPRHHHSMEFMAIFYRLLEKAEEAHIYHNVFDDSYELVLLTKHIHTRCIIESGLLFKELGSNLNDAFNLCIKIGGRFEDYLDRVLRIPRTTATLAMQVYSLDINPDVGLDNMRFLSKIENAYERKKAEQLILDGAIPATVRMELLDAGQPKLSKHEFLEQEKIRLNHTMQNLSKRLLEIEQELKTYENSTEKTNL
ncbi:MAG: hypothetical protein LBQ77_06090 [Treponema sp.]|jgi:hypothetical protein|nr:hypothetical protein [Treponema sp.]